MMDDRAERLKQMKPDLIADVELYDSHSGGKDGPIRSGYGCPLMTSKVPPFSGWDALPLLGDDPMFPGEKRRLGYVFLSEEGLNTIRHAGRFYLWDGGFIGEASVIANPETNDT